MQNPLGSQSELTRHSTQVWVAVSQTGVSAEEQLLVLLQVAPQVCPLEQFGVAFGQSVFSKQSTHTCWVTSQCWGEQSVSSRHSTQVPVSVSQTRFGSVQPVRALQVGPAAPAAPP
jgi:hypothetical protein